MIKRLHSGFLVIAFFLLLFAPGARAANYANAGWTISNPFQQKVFIENKGQFEIPGKIAVGQILFSANTDGLDYYFTSGSIWVVRTTPSPSDSNQLAQQFHQLFFAGSNAMVQISGEDEVSQHYNYILKGNLSIKANAFSKITYTNLYPGIDMEVYFPDNKQGFEYSFLIHPGADVSLIQIQYPLNKGLAVSAEGNINIQSTYGQFIDHAPVAQLQNSAQKTNCSFLLQNGTVQFATGNYDKSKALVIDPWTRTPVFTGTNKAYNVDWDNAGNCYVYGGDGNNAAFPFKFIKYNKSGTQLWSISLTNGFAGTYGTGFYANFVVNRNSQSIYIAEGGNFQEGAQILEFNSQGTLIDTTVGNPNLVCIWRIAMSPDNTELIGAGGSFYINPNATTTYTALYADTNLANATFVNVLNPPAPYYYMWGMITDKSGNCYMALASRGTDPDSVNNLLYKLPLPSLTPQSWVVNDGYEFHVIGQVAYMLPFNNTNSYNGMAISGSALFTYDSYTLDKWNTANGALINRNNINGSVTPEIRWGGITANNCGGIYLGSRTTIKEYDRDLNLLTSFAAADTIYDVNFSTNNILYVCGDGFVSAIPIDSISVANKVQNFCGPVQNRIYTLSISRGTPPYNITWNTNPVQTDTIITNLSPGIMYIATVTDQFCAPIPVYDTIIVTPSIQVMAGNVTASSDSVCPGNYSTLSLSGNTASVIQWQSSLTQGNFTNVNAATGTVYQTASLKQTNYFRAVVSNNICSDTSASIQIFVQQLIAGTLSVNRDTICYGTPANLSLIGGSGDIQWQSSVDDINFTGITGAPDTAKYKSEPLDQTTWYRANVVAGNCSAVSDTLKVYVPPSLTAFYTYTISGSKVTFNSAGSSGNIRSYNWDFGDSSLSTEANPTHTFGKADSVYYACLTLYDGSNCSYTYCSYIHLVLSGIPYYEAGADFIFYPNPFSNLLEVKSETDRVDDVAIYNVLGEKMVINNATWFKDNFVGLDVSSLADGVYFLKVQTDRESVLKRVVKQ